MRVLLFISLIVSGATALVAQPRFAQWTRPYALRTRMPVPVALYNDDPWLKGDERGPLSAESTEVLLRYGPVVWRARCFDSDEYNASVRKLMARYPKM